MDSYGDITIKNNSRFLKIESGFPHDIRLLSPAPTEKSLHGFGKEAVECTGKECEECAGGHQAKQRFSADVYDFTTGRAMTWEFGGSVAKQLKKIDITLKEEGGAILQTDLKVEAEGQNMQKKYTVTPRRTSKPLPEGIGVSIGF